MRAIRSTGPRNALVSLALALAALAFLSPVARAASETSKRPAISRMSIDLDTGAVLEASDADAPRWPASLAKLMTAYVAFEALEKGDIAWETPVRVSKHAASQRPVKAWLAPGETQPFGALLSAALTASSNDAAMAVAEAVGGDEAGFVARMNDAAEAIGMRGAHFVNPHGLPQPGQRVTARDIALLTRALLTRHPERSEMFAQRTTRLGKRRMSTTNPLFGRYAGAAGMKTGFTCRAGYSIAALAKRDGRRVIAVTLGAPNKTDRLSTTTAQLDRAFAALASTELHRHFAEMRLKPISVRPDDPDAAPPSVRACTPSAGGGPQGYAVFLGARANRGWATRQSTRAQRIGREGGAVYIGRRGDRRWAAMLHGYSRAQAIRACRRLRSAGAYCLTLSPKARRIRRALWR